MIRFDRRIRLQFKTLTRSWTSPRANPGHARRWRRYPRVPARAPTSWPYPPAWWALRTQCALY